MTTPSASFATLLAHLKEARAFDFTGYKRSSLVRPVDRRMAQVGVTDYLDYLDHLQVHPDEFTTLFNTILINVTSFFRDPDAWDFLGTQCLPTLLATRHPDAPVRVWSAGCASGEEAYTLAMVLAEALGPDHSRPGTSGGRCGTSMSRSARSSCAATSSSPTSSGVRCGCPMWSCRGRARTRCAWRSA